MSATIKCVITDESTGKARQLSAHSSAHVSVGFVDENGKPLLIHARVLAYVDPATGKAVVRLGMFDTSKANRGTEIGKQLIWESDEPCVFVEGQDD